jgi:hypothetical protein
MKTNIKFLFASILVVISLLVVANKSYQHAPGEEVAVVETSVYICDSESSYAFHSSESCRGIKRCTHGILKVSKADAMNKYGRKACKICY